jgi:hypothetical protein
VTKLAFWIHQFVEYALGVVLLTEGARSGRPAVPMTAGTILLFVAATGDGPLQAIGRFPRKTHRTLDLVTALVIGLAAALPIGWANTTGRVVMGVTAGLWLVLIWRTNYRPRPVRVRRAARREAARRAMPPSDGAVPPSVPAWPTPAGARSSAPAPTLRPAGAPADPAASRTSDSGGASAPPSATPPHVPGGPARPRPAAAAVSRATGRVVGAGVRAYRRRKAGP